MQWVGGEAAHIQMHFSHFVVARYQIKSRRKPAVHTVLNSRLVGFVWKAKRYYIDYVYCNIRGEPKASN